jgi:dipeptidyl aminopeptidase/acylaminoacyl peptidase
VRAADGTLLIELEEGDISYLTSLGWRPPERVTVKATDGVTDLFGLVFLPTGGDPRGKYPVVDSVYPGPQSIVTEKAFPADYSWNAKIFWKCQALAELGFVVVNLDGPGTPYRSKAFHDAAYGHMGDAGGLVDHVAGIATLSRNRSYMDLGRVGIYGHSGGGFMTAQALLTYPEFYTAGVASAGNQDNRLYGSYWGEKYEGMPDGDNYLEQVTALKASNLTGHLLLVTGDLDDNVHPSMSLQLANALVDANKTFDMLVLPNRNHHFNYDPYFMRRQFDYFVLNLQGAAPPDYTFDVPWIA